MKITLYKPQKVDGENKRKESIYKIPFVSARHHRKLLEYEQTIDYTEMTLENTDELVGFVCDVFGNQFTIDEFYDGVPSHELVSVIGDVFFYVRTGKDPKEVKEEGNEEGKS
ncbi:phage tail assembly chaperone G [Oceanobacillus kimchii]|uniref:phage tail assembly chaperone G n=1 Tax=Oceanobacillus kimchii TaxID=746691 RepID=UPI00034B22FA|nr:hypothetical protein [Oceanobacillus kimchii]